MNKLMQLLSLGALAACSGQTPSGLQFAGAPVVATGASHSFAVLATGQSVIGEICLRSCIGDYTPRTVAKVNALSVGAPCVLSAQKLDRGALTFELASAEAAECEVSADVTLDDGEELVNAAKARFMKVESLAVQCDSGTCAGPNAWLEGAHAGWRIEGRATDAMGKPVAVEVSDVAASSSDGALLEAKADHDLYGWSVIADAMGVGEATVTVTAGGVRRDIGVRVVPVSRVRVASLVPARPPNKPLDAAETPFEPGALPATMGVQQSVDIAVRAELDDGTVAVGNVNDVAVTPDDGLSEKGLDSARSFVPASAGRHLLVSLVGSAEARWEVDVTQQ
jgi:hypothetical protein